MSSSHVVRKQVLCEFLLALIWYMHQVSWTNHVVIVYLNLPPLTQSVEVGDSCELGILVYQS